LRLIARIEKNWELKLSRIMKKTGKLGVNFGGHVGFWVKNKDHGVNLQGLGRMGKIKTFKNVRKRSKIFKNVQKYSKIFKKIRKCVRSFEQKFITFLF